MAQAQTDTAGQGQKGAFAQTLGVNHHIIARIAQGPYQLAQGGQTVRRPPAGIPQPASGQAMQPGDHRGTLQQGCPPIFTAPPQLMAGPGQIGGQRQGVDDVPERAKTDDQDAHRGQTILIPIGSATPSPCWDPRGRIHPAQVFPAMPMTPHEDDAGLDTDEVHAEAVPPIARGHLSLGKVGSLQVTSKATLCQAVITG
jgi:hypothetical protein